VAEFWTNMVRTIASMGASIVRCSRHESGEVGNFGYLNQLNQGRHKFRLITHSLGDDISPEAIACV
jgi:hypothetical protein